MLRYYNGVVLFCFVLFFAPVVGYCVWFVDGDFVAILLVFFFFVKNRYPPLGWCSPWRSDLPMGWTVSLGLA